MDLAIRRQSHKRHVPFVVISPATSGAELKTLLSMSHSMTGLEDFSSTLDKAQKMFDQVMAQLNGGGNNSDAWRAEGRTFAVNVIPNYTSL